jgi:hypothetical protein
MLSLANVMETIGNLIDKLTIVNMRIWMFEDIKRTSEDDRTIANATRKTNVLNQQRTDLIQEIDELVLGLIDGSKTMKTYKQGDMKMYGKGKK